MTPARRLSRLRRHLAAVEGLCQKLHGSQARTWQPLRIPKPTPPPEPARAHRCPACRRAGAALWTCTGCGRQLCEHRMKVQRLDGTGFCRRCAWARVRAFNDHFGLTSSDPSGT